MNDRSVPPAPFVDAPERIGSPATAGRPGLASPAVAALLSFVLPGLGQTLIGRVRRGFLLALPTIAIPVVAMLLFLQGRGRTIGVVASPPVLEALLVANVAYAAYHVLAIVDAHRLARRDGGRRWTRASAVGLAALVVATLALHGGAEAIGYQSYDAVTHIFQSSPDTGVFIPSPSFAPTPTPSPAPSGEPTPVATPSPTPGPAWAADGRLNVLLIGSDAGPGRWSLRTDSMEVLSVDIASGRAALFGFPRNQLNVPLAPEDRAAFPNLRYPGLLNSLYVYANQHPTQFPGTDATRGFRAVAGAIQELIGMPLDGVVVVDLNGFVRLVDAIGGLWVDIPYPIYDTAYPQENGAGDVTLSLRAGCQHLNGHYALALARTRHQDSDYQRMARQQLVLRALARQIDPLALVPKVPELISIARDDLWTTFATSDIPDLAALAARVDRAGVREIRFIPPQIPETLTSDALRTIQATVRSIFTGGVAPAASPGTGPAATGAPGASMPLSTEGAPTASATAAALATPAATPRPTSRCG